MTNPTPEQDRMHTLAREINQGKQQAAAARDRAEVDKRENPESYRSNAIAARNAERFVVDRTAKLKAEFGATDVDAVARDLVIDKGLSFRDKGHVSATTFEG